MMKRTILLLVPALVATCGMSAATLLDDNFNAENGGTGVLNYNAFSNWKVDNGTVDLIGNGFFDFLPGNGLYVDMDGSTQNAGRLTSITPFNFIPGEIYTLSFDLAGNRRNGSSESTTVQVEVGLFSQVYSLAQNDPFQNFSTSFSVPVPTSGVITFEGSGGDQIGMLLDNVKLVSRSANVPDSGSLTAVAACATGLLLVGARRARK